MPRNSTCGSRLVMDLGVVCLICLRAEPGYCSIYGQDLETPQMQIVDKIRSCSALKLEKQLLSQLPDKICHGCRNELSITYRFQQKCLEAQKVFQSAATAALLNVDKLELGQAQQLKLSSSLQVKRLKTEHASSLLEYYNEDDGDCNGQDAVTTLVLPDVTTAVASDNDDKLLALDVDWGIEQTEPQRPSESEPELELQQEQDLNREDDDYKLCNEPCVDGIATPRLPANSSINSQTVAVRNRRSTEPKICDICGNTYKYQHALNAHMRRHNNDRPYPCEVCQKAFISNVELRRHMRVHTGQKPYGCHYCERRFSDFGSSKKHERIHTGERPYVCEVCNKGFAYAHVLSVHRRTHTGKKQFQCTQCDKGFTKKCYLATHMEQHRLNKLNGMMVSTALYHRIPNRKQQQHPQQQQQQKEHHQKPLRQVRCENSDGVADVDDCDDDYDNASVGISIRTLNQVGGEQSKVLEECIVNNDFIFNDEDADETDHDIDDYHELDDNEFHSVQHVKVPYELVTDLLDSDDLVSDTKYLME